MNKFKESLKVNINNEKNNKKINTLEELLPGNYLKRTTFIEKLEVNIQEAIRYTLANSKEEEDKKMEVMKNVDRFLEDYENDAEFRKILADYSYAKKYRIIQPKEER